MLERLNPLGLQLPSLKKQIISKMILEKRGHCPLKFDKTFKLIKLQSKLNKKQQRSSVKLFGGKIFLDNRTNIHKHLLSLFSECDPPVDIEKPLVVGGTKLKTYIFTKKKFYKKMRSKWLTSNA